MPISRRDLPLVIEATDALYRVLENPEGDLSKLSTPVGWKPFAPAFCKVGGEGGLPKLDRGNWSPPKWWVAFCQAIGFQIDPNERPYHHWAIHGVIQVVLARLMPSGVNGKRECPDITNSDLDLPHRVALLKLRKALVASFGYDIIHEPSTALEFRGSLLTVLNALEGSANSSANDAQTRERCNQTTTRTNKRSEGGRPSRTEDQKAADIKLYTDYQSSGLTKEEFIKARFPHSEFEDRMTRLETGRKDFRKQQEK